MFKLLVHLLSLLPIRACCPQLAPLSACNCLELESRVLMKILRVFLDCFVVYLVGTMPLYALAPLLIPLIFGSEFVFEPVVVLLLFLSTLFSMLAIT